MYMNSKSPLCPLHEHFQPIFSSFGKVFGTRTWAMMSWLRNASCLLTQFVLLLGDSRPGLFLTGPGSKMACGLDLIHSDVNEHRGMCLFWGSRSHRPRVETYARRVSFSHTHWLPQGRVGRGLLKGILMWSRAAAGLMRIAENPHRIESYLSNLTVIHSCN